MLDLIDLVGAIQPEESDVLADLARDQAKPNAVFAEVGCWKGHSASILGKVIKEQGGQLFCIDHWQGSIGTGLVQSAKVEDVYKVFEHNLQVLELWDYITPMKLESSVAAKLFADGSIDFLFLDADHRYSAFMKDLEVWTPKIKSGGIICGHDCEVYYRQIIPDLRDLLDIHLEEDYAGGYHAGVIKGLHDYFREGYVIADKTRIWAKVM